MNQVDHSRWVAPNLEDKENSVGLSAAGQLLAVSAYASIVFIRLLIGLSGFELFSKGTRTNLSRCGSILGSEVTSCHEVPDGSGAVYVPKDPIPNLDQIQHENLKSGSAIVKREEDIMLKGVLTTIRVEKEEPESSYWVKILGFWLQGEPHTHPA